MRKILAIVWKDILVRFSSPIELIFFIVLPVFFTLVLAGGSGAPRDGRVRLAIVDQAATPLAKELSAVLARSEAVRVDPLALDQAESQFSQRQVVAVLVIPTGFDLSQPEGGQAGLELRVLPNSVNGMVVERAVQSAINRISAAVSIATTSTSAAEKIHPFADPAERAAFFERALKAAQAELGAAPERLEVTAGITPDNIEYDPRGNSSAGQLITWVFIPLLGISSLFAYERQQGTLRRLLTTPTHRAVFLLGTISGQVLMALVQMGLLIVFGVLVLRLSWGREPLALLVMLLAAALAAAALGTALGTVVKTEGQANGLSIMLGMVMGLLGGCWYPLELFPPAVQTAVKVLPTSWAMQGLLDLAVRGQGLAAILPEVGVLLGFAALFFTVGIARFRYE